MKLFMTAHELMNHPAGDLVMDSPAGDLDAHTMANFPSIATSKLHEAKIGPKSATHGFEASPYEETLYDSIKNEGVKKPVSLHFDDDNAPLPIINDGHHRIAAANDINPNMFIPVNYGSGWSGWDFKSNGK